MKRTFRGIVNVEFWGDSDIAIGSHSCGKGCIASDRDEPDETKCVICLLEALNGKSVRVTVEAL
jgi:hypothetical protein